MIPTTDTQPFVDRQSLADAAAAPWRRSLVAIAGSLTLLALWAITHRYHGFSRDGALYAIQALAKIEPSLNADIYLQNTTQDQYTVFSPLYALFIKTFGLPAGEFILFVLCQAGFYSAAWTVARRTSSPRAAWFGVGLLVVTVGYYGAYEIFSYAENYLSARSLGEALVVIALACHLKDWRWPALLVAALGMTIHPLMVLPGLILLVCLNLPPAAATALCAAGVMLCGLIAAVAAHATQGPAGIGAPHLLGVMDPAWLEVVRERSQFLFLQYWRWSDWEIAARPLVCLCLTLAALVDGPARRLAYAAVLLGASGLAVALIGGTVGPVAVLVQGQAWRWMWVTGFVSVVLVVPTAVVLWRDARGGPLCAVLLMLAWTYPELDGLATAGAALALWLVRRHLSPSAARYLRWAAIAVAGVVVLWVIAHAWTYLRGAVPESGREALLIARLREVFGLGVTGALVAGGLWWWIDRARSWAVPAGVSCAMLGVVCLVLPGSVKQMDATGTPAQVREFDDWRRAIPPGSNTLIVPLRTSAAFSWFTLERPNYLSVDQSSGVVFSPLTAAEVRRRSEVLRAIAEPDWRILTRLTAARNGARKDDKPQPLTRRQLERICSDPVLGFVIAKESLGFDPLPHAHAGAFKDWNLYDCARVRRDSGT